MTREISLEIENEEIVFADISSREQLEVVIVCKSGHIYLYEVEKKKKSYLAKLSFNSVPNLVEDFNIQEVINNLSPTELQQFLQNQSFEIESIESITERNQDFIKILSLNAILYSFNNYICIVQKYGQHGVVFNLENPEYKKILHRGDYQVLHCTFPIAFYEKNNQTFLIHGTDWNRLDITCLETDELLTDRIVDYDTNSNYFDYFHSSLTISSDGKNFLSNGWHWHPYGQIYCFSVESFLQDFESSKQSIDVSDEDFYDLDCDRPICWIDNKTLAIGFNRQICDENQNKFPNEILFFDIEQSRIINRIKFDGLGLTSEGNVYGLLDFNDEKKAFISLNSQSGLLISDINGEVIVSEPSFTSHKYSPKDKLLYQFDLENQLLKTSEIKLP